MKKYLLAFLTYSSREQRGILALLIIIALLNLFFEGYALFCSQNETPLSIKIDTLGLVSASDFSSPNDVASRDLPQSHSQSVLLPQEEVQPQALFPFDPNATTVVEWKRLGLSLRQAMGILHYVEKGGRYRMKSDLKKMYGMTDSLYARLEPFIQLPDSVPASPKSASLLTPTPKRFDKTVRLLELNTADSLALLDLPGIGPWFAFKIINYRARLGGFQRKEQLLEVRGMDTLRYRQMENRLTVDPFEIQKLDVNKAPQEALSQHPYVGFLLAKMLVNYRIQHGNFKRLEEIKTLPLVDADLYSKLAPYLSLSP